jgi:hypothetical protein
MENRLNSAEYYEQTGDQKLAKAMRDGARSSQELLTTLEQAYAYITTIRILSNDLANRILQDSQ